MRVSLDYGEAGDPNGSENALTELTGNGRCGASKLSEGLEEVRKRSEGRPGATGYSRVR